MVQSPPIRVQVSLEPTRADLVEALIQQHGKYLELLPYQRNFLSVSLLACDDIIRVW